VREVHFTPFEIYNIYSKILIVIWRSDMWTCYNDTGWTDVIVIEWTDVR